VKYRNRGFGQKLRGQLHAVLKSAGYRKVYCTVPSINDGAVGYLLASEYKIEAHLQRQYHNHHNEFVFGHPLVADRGAGKEYYRPNTPVTEIAYLEESSPQVVAFMQQEFCETYCKLPDDWAARQVETATKKTKSRFKPREIYVGEIRGNVAAVALCLPKRGGGTKILLATHTSHLDSLVEIISRVESDARRTKPSPRKLYSLVSIFDTAVQKAFFKSGFGSEGILDRPYRPSEDLVVLSKMLT
jgi:hypothetical protein